MYNLLLIYLGYFYLFFFSMSSLFFFFLFAILLYKTIEPELHFCFKSFHYFISLLTIELETGTKPWSRSYFSFI